MEKCGRRCYVYVDLWTVGVSGRKIVCEGLCECYPLQMMVFVGVLVDECSEKVGFSRCSLVQQCLVCWV